MSVAEATRAVALIRKVSERRTLIMIEHDMGVVFDLADRISVLVYGEMIARTTPGADQTEQRGAGGLSRAERRDARRLRPARLLRQEPHPAGRFTCVGAGEIVSILGRNGVGRSTTLKAIMGNVPPKGSITFKDKARSPASSRTRSRSGPRLRARGTRDLSDADGRAEPDPRRQAGGKAGRWSVADDLPLFPQLRGARRRAGRRALRRRAADADDLPHPDGRPRSGHDRRADRGTSAANGRTHCRAPAKIAERGISILLVEQKLTIAMRISHRVYVMGHGRMVFDGTPSELQRGSRYKPHSRYQQKKTITARDYRTTLAMCPARQPTTPRAAREQEI
jgi:branched-chain amino acid transport system ATP-binding protein